MADIGFDDDKTENARAKGNDKTKKKGNRFIRGVKNFLNEEGAAAREDHETLRNLRENPKY